MSAWAVGVVVPAHDEERLVGRCVETVRRSVDAAGVDEAWIVVVADACTDRTARVARRALGPRGEVVPCAARSVGAARRLGARRVLRRLASRPGSRLWLMNTDADTRVPRDWVATHLRLADAGSTAVAGIVEVDSFAEHGDRVARAFAAAYAVGPDGRHPHVHGANLGVRADVYRAVGGWCGAALAEDHRLWARLRRHGARIASSAASRVLTSGRRIGRAPGGFADALRGLGEVADG